jgi:ATP-dependent DNA helicase DinG
MKSRDVLGPEGTLAKKLPGYEIREVQMQMAEAVEQALDRDQPLICEAGTGTGKTLAYLVPALLSGRKVVVSTATKALQEQIFEKDLPLLQRTAGLRVRAVMVKGLNNYVCLRKYNEFRSSAEALRPQHASALRSVEPWVQETETGELSELVTLQEDHPIRLEIASSSETRVGSGCPYYEDCFITRMKREAEQAQLLVVNHHLFFADLALKGPHQGGALPAYDVVIFDEAHQVEDIATQFFGTRVSSSRLELFLRDAERTFLATPGKHDTKHTLRLMTQGREAAQGFFQQFQMVGQNDGGKSLLSREQWQHEHNQAYFRLDNVLGAIENHAELIGSSESLDIVARRAKTLRDDLAKIIALQDAHVTWLETGARNTALGASPIAIASILHDKLFEPNPSVILTSATLSTQGGFEFFKQRIGLDKSIAEVNELIVESPFDYTNRALLYLPTHLPECSNPGFTPKAANCVWELLQSNTGGSFVLCTSVRSMHSLYQELLRLRVGPLFLQGQAPKQALLRKFRAAKHGVLVATMSFWEGVDVPGEALRLVVIDKVPFPVPSDPVVHARSLALEEAGHNPFMKYHVPMAAITLKQGFGRLLRTLSDIGVVAILDRRIVTKGYGKRLLSTLPNVPRTGDIQDVHAFFQRWEQPVMLPESGSPNDQNA